MLMNLQQHLSDAGVGEADAGRLQTSA